MASCEVVQPNAKKSKGVGGKAHTVVSQTVHLSASSEPWRVYYGGALPRWSALRLNYDAAVNNGTTMAQDSATVEQWRIVFFFFLTA